MPDRDRQLGAWSSAEAEDRYRRVVDQIWDEECAHRPDELNLETSAGTTRVYRWSGAGDPILLLHRMGSSTMQWLRLVGDLGDHAVYGVDTIGDLGRSVHRAPIENETDLADWLEETLAGLGLERVCLVGDQYGAFIAANHATRYSGRVATIVMVDPDGFDRLSARLLVYTAKYAVAAVLPLPLRRRAARRLAMPSLIDKRVSRLALHAIRHHPFPLPSAPAWTDGQLEAINVPVLVLIGKRSVKYDADLVAARLATTIPKVEVAVLPGVGHAIPLEPTAHAGGRIREFIATHTK